jgi:hypothetical protein
LCSNVLLYTASVQVAREIWLHAQLVHPAIIAMYAAWKDREHVWMVLEWADEVGLRLQHGRLG